ncbi:MAG TPA: HEAT repeat domain-containing protein [Vicinamibacterales bacterium]|nr:HEAT repeat domain-containing protein [Vicinamibacterales bacterium]
MAEPAAPAVLPPEAAARLAEFARTCKAAARAVSLYPGGHPAITLSLSRLAEAGGRLTESGPVRLQVHPDGLAIDGARPPRPDPALPELAGLLHRHLVGALAINPGVPAESWRTLLLLLARPPEDVRADGGIARLWETAGGPSLEVREIDYTEVLREKQGLAGTIDDILQAAVSGAPGALHDGRLQALLDIVRDPFRLDELMKQLESRAADVPQGVELQTRTFLALVRGLVDYVSRTAPGDLNALFERLGQGARRLSVEAMIALLSERSRPEALQGSVNVVSALIESMSDTSVAGFVADAVVAERGASERLAHAFRSLVPELDRQRQLLGLARAEVAASDLGRESNDFPQLWQGVERMLTSYTDARYVSEDYARELSHARTQPVDVEKTGDDPPERVAGWLATVSDAALRNLDRDLLTDLLAIESDPSRWRDIAETVVGHADDLVRVGYFDQAWHLIDAMIAQADRSPLRKPHGLEALERFARGSLMKHVAGHLRVAEDDSYERFKRICHVIGSAVIVPLAEVLAAEQDARSRRRLRDILVGFGAAGAESVRPLMHAPNWEVRRTAAFLLREFGGAEGLKTIVPLLTDREPLVRQEAVQALLSSGSAEASGLLLEAVALDRTGQLAAEILRVREDRAAPFFAHVIRRADRRKLPRLYLAAIEALGSAGGEEAVEPLKLALHRGSWRNMLADRRFRAAAARSLRRVGTPATLDVLREAVSRGSRGVRAAARAELTRVESSS